MNNMKAAVYEKYGPPEVLYIKEVETPKPKDNEVLIRVFATTVNRTDCAMLRAKPFIMRFFTGLVKPKKQILGIDFAGRIESVGKDVKTLKTGDRVFGIDDSGLCSHAQYMTFPENKAIAVIPEGSSYEQAAASLEGVHYAFNFINKVPGLTGKKVLVNGATGAIGSATVQLLKYFGAHVTAVCNTKNIALIRSIGADEIIDYLKEDFTKNNQKYNFVFDAVGKSTFSKCKPLLENGGVYISSELGPMAQNPFLAIFTSITGSKKVIFPIPTDCKKSVLLIKKITEEGKFKPVIDKIFPLQEIAEAFRYVETGEKTGNVVINLA
jgi:NADPH:quinone reductase-like Zn-dependent oxidoreductase